MGVRYSHRPVIYTTIRADTAANMIGDIDAALTSIGIQRTAVTGGFKYTLQSPEGLQMKLWIQDLGDHTIFNTFIRFTPTSMDEMETGQIQAIFVGAAGFPAYEIWANCCQFFLAPPGFASGNSSVNFACGVLALPANSTGACTAGAGQPTVTELWWTSSSGTGAFGEASSFRNSRYATGSYSLAYNGNVYVAPANSDPLLLSLLVLCAAVNVDFSRGSPARVEKYGSGLGLRIDAFLAHAQQIYGQLWDAHIYTLPATLDSTVNLTDVDDAGNTVETSWLAWNNSVGSDPNGGGGTVLGTLFLLTSLLTEEIANVAY